MRTIDVEKIRAICKAKGVSQRKLAEKSGVNRSTINMLVNCKIAVCITTIKKIADALEVNVEELYTTDNEEAKTTGEIVKRLCENKGMTKKELAEKAGVSEVTVTSVISEKHTPRISILNRISNALEVDVRELNVNENYIETNQTTGDIIRWLCIKKGMSQRKLAKKADVSQFTISCIINNRYQSSIEMLKKIADAFGVKVEELYPEGSPEREALTRKSTGAIIMRLCLEKGITKRELSCMSEVSYPVISKIIKDDNYKPRIDTLELIAKALDVQLEVLLP